MKIKNIRAAKFRRFTDLTIQNIPETAKLVLIVGPNGCGKSSLFDVFDTWQRFNKGHGRFDINYHCKSCFKGKDKHRPQEDTQVDFYHLDNKNKNRVFYIRSAYRNEPSFTLCQLQRMQTTEDDNVVLEKLIDNDTRVSRNYQILVSTNFEDYYGTDRDIETNKEGKERMIGSINTPLNSIFPDLELTGLGNPLVDGSFYFTKGDSENFPYMNLSGGEKAVFDMILDIVVKKKVFNDTVFCIDEPALHLNSKLQGALLKELYDLIPNNCQLWLASHSIGIMNKAFELYKEDNSKVCFLDFSDHDFDQTVVMEPANVSKELWRKNLDIALDEMANLVAPKRIVVCEGDPTGTKNKEFDAKCYTKIFQQEYPDTEFISIGNSTDVVEKSNLLLSHFEKFVTGIEIVRLVDRDIMSTSEVEELKGRGIQVLNQRHLEAYLFDDEIIKALCAKSGQPGKEAEALQAKADAISRSIGRGKESDDMKSSSGELSVSLRKLLSLESSGSTQEAFCKDILCPLIIPGTKVYAAIKKDIFNE